MRLYNTLLGQDGFRKGMDLYFERHDGQAALPPKTFLQRWQMRMVSISVKCKIGTIKRAPPTVDVTMDYDSNANTCTLHFTQVFTDTSEAQAEQKQPYLIPIKIGLLKDSGKEILCETVQLTQQNQSVTFENIAFQPIPSLLRDFSAPVKLNYDYSVDDMIFLMRHDTDSFNRWEASQRLTKTLMLDMLERKTAGEAYGVEPRIIDAFQSVLTDENLDNGLKAEALSLPSENDIAEAIAYQGEKADPEAIHEVRELMQKNHRFGITQTARKSFRRIIK